MISRSSSTCAARVFAIFLTVVGRSTLAQAPPYRDPECRAHRPNADGVPACPTGARLLPDSIFPAMAVAVSDEHGGAPFVVDFVLKALRGQPNPPPQFILNSQESTLRRVREAIEREPGLDAASRERWLRSVARMEGPQNQWQQDYFRPTVDTETGRPSIRPIALYRPPPRTDLLTQGWNALVATPNDPRPAFASIASLASGACGIDQGAAISTGAVNERSKSGHKGGNMIGLPDGGCTIGDDHLSPNERLRLARDVCGGRDRLVEAPTSFLTTGHVDEIMFVARTSDRSPPCNFAILLASPDAALESLRREPQGFFFSSPNGNASEQATRVRQSSVYRSVCRGVLAFLRDRRPTREGQTRGTRTEALLRALEPEARAIFGLWGSDTEDPSRCAQIRNQDVLDYWASNPEIAQANRTIQQSMTAYRDLLRTRFEGTMPGCRGANAPRFVNVPNLFAAKPRDRAAEAAGFPTTGSESIFPNPTNAQQFGDRVIYPEPGNEAFRRSLQTAIQGLGAQPDPIESWPLHLRGGNVHCGTNAIRYCRPVAATPPAVPAPAARPPVDPPRRRR